MIGNRDEVDRHCAARRRDTRSRRSAAEAATRSAAIRSQNRARPPAGIDNAGVFLIERLEQFVPGFLAHG